MRACLKHGAVLILLSSCQQFKPQSNQHSKSNVQDENTADGIDGKPKVGTEKATELILATTQLKANPGAYQATIQFLQVKIQQEFTPSGPDVRLLLPNLPANESGVLTLEIYQGDKLKFIVKQANTKLEKAQSNRIIVDDCRILPAPWDGQQHNGSCDWSIAEK